MQPTSNVNNFFGIKVSKQGIPVNQASDKELIYKSNFSTETWYDSSGSAALKLGLQSDGTYGLSLNPDNNSNSLIINQNYISIYENGIEQIRMGLLPDNSYGLVITKPGISVTDAYN